MQVSEFERHVESFRQSDVLSDRELVENFALGLIGETGEVVDLIKKKVFHGEDIAVEKLTKEIGDALWYTIALLQILEIESSMSDFLRLAVNKNSLLVDRGLPKSCLALGKCSGKIAQHIACYETSKDLLDFTTIEVLLSDYFCVLMSLAWSLNLSLEVIMQANVDKLVSRHGGNAFDRQAAIDYKAQHGSD